MKYKIIFTFLFINNLFGANSNLGESLPLISLMPFVGILLSIAIIPLISASFWHDNFGKISVFWSILFITPLYLLFWF